MKSRQEMVGPGKGGSANCLEFTQHCGGRVSGVRLMLALGTEAFPQRRKGIRNNGAAPFVGTVGSSCLISVSPHCDSLGRISLLQFTCEETEAQRS